MSVEASELEMEAVWEVALVPAWVLELELRSVSQMEVKSVSESVLVLEVGSV